MTSTTSPSTSRRMVLAFVAIVAVALAVAIGTISGGDPAVPTSAFGEPAIVGTPLPPLAAGDDPAVGMDAPTLTGTALDGTELTIGSGGPQVVAFLAHWCSHCRAEVPVVVDWIEQGRMPDGVALYAVATSTDAGQPNFPPQAWLEREGWTAPTLLDNDRYEAGEFYGVSSFPFWTVIDGEGRVVLRVSGGLAPEQLDVLFSLALAPTGS